MNHIKEVRVSGEDISIIYENGEIEKCTVKGLDIKKFEDFKKERIVINKLIK